MKLGSGRGRPVRASAWRSAQVSARALIFGIFLAMFSSQAMAMGGEGDGDDHDPGETCNSMSYGLGAFSFGTGIVGGLMLFGGPVTATVGAGVWAVSLLSGSMSLGVGAAC